MDLPYPPSDHTNDEHFQRRRKDLVVARKIERHQVRHRARKEPLPQNYCYRRRGSALLQAKRRKYPILVPKLYQRHSNSKHRCPKLQWIVKRWKDCANEPGQQQDIYLRLLPAVRSKEMDYHLENAMPTQLLLRLRCSLRDLLLLVVEATSRLRPYQIRLHQNPVQLLSLRTVVELQHLPLRANRARNGNLCSSAYCNLLTNGRRMQPLA
mmetsp:Transcript_409/g.805  ORF Transcript_409/g.805 Transcript_409/m.805 type:complete len:210 (+) Transcript_409:68-697(+)